MMFFDCIKMPAIYVRDYCTKCIHMVGTNEHDRLYLDDDGHIQYFNLQNGCGTPDEYDFVLDPEGHDQNNLPFTEEEQIMYGLSNMDAYFGGVDLKKAQSLTERAEKTKEETNFEHYYEDLLKEKGDYGFANGKVKSCLGMSCSDCKFYTSDIKSCCKVEKIKWLSSPYKEYKEQTYKLTKFEYDLLNAHKDSGMQKCLSNYRPLLELNEKGYFKYIDTSTPIHEILDNCEVIK